MQTKNMPRGLRRGCATLLAAALLGACATATPVTGGDGGALELDPAEPAAARTSARVKAALLEASDIDAAAIGVAVDGERLRLDGFVGSAAEAERALAIARERAPGREIVSDIRVR